MHTYYVLVLMSKTPLKAGDNFKIGDSSVYTSKEAANTAYTQEKFCDPIDNLCIVEIELANKLRLLSGHSDLYVDHLTRNSSRPCRAVHSLDLNHGHLKRNTP